MRYENWKNPSHIHCKRCDCIQDTGCHIWIDDNRGSDVLLEGDDGDCPYENETVE
jgi:hypothetical protein